MSESKQSSPISSVFGYLLSVLLVLIYVQMYPVWKVLSTFLDVKILHGLPVAVTAFFLVVVLFLFRYRQKKTATSIPGLCLITGVALCGAALALPDPALPVKRIHVAEYMLLSLVVRYAMSYRLKNLDLLFFSACFAALLGVHDEFLQGLHPSRTYGLRDMTVNGLGSVGGALIWHAFGFFNRIPMDARGQSTNHKTSFTYIAWLLASVLALVWPLAFYRTAYQPYWPAMPLLGAIVFFIMYKNHFNRAAMYGIIALSAVSLPMILYPVVTNVSSILFY